MRNKESAFQAKIKSPAYIALDAMALQTVYQTFDSVYQTFYLRLVDCPHLCPGHIPGHIDLHCISLVWIHTVVLNMLLQFRQFIVNVVDVGT